MNLTEKSIAKLIPAKNRAHFYDNGTRGFGLRVESKDDGGRKSYFWRAKVGGLSKFVALGEHPTTPLSEARDKARKLVGQAAAWRETGFSGPDPFIKTKRVQRSNVPLFCEMVEAYIAECLKNPDPNIGALNKRKAEYDLRLACRNHFHAWLNRPLDQIDVNDVLQVKAKCGAHHFAANSCIEYVRRIYNWAARTENDKLNYWECKNPAQNISLYPHGMKTARERFLQPQELVRFHEELEEEANVDVRDVLILLLSTGARKSNVFAMKWEEISFDLRVWRLPMSKSGEGYTVPLSPAALKVLDRRERTRSKSEFVFPSRSASGHVTDIKKTWHVIRKRAGFPDVRLHDLRRTRGALAAISGESLQKVGALLGHAENSNATAIYARLNSESIRAASDAADETMERMMRQARKQPKQLGAARG